MNLALSALALIVLLLPGYFATQAYLGQIGRSGSRDAVGNDGVPRAWLRALIVAPLIHCIAIFILSRYLVPQVSIGAVLGVLAAAPYKDNPAVYAAIARYPYAIFWYFTLVTLAAALAGVALHKVVRRYQLDLKFQWLRFPNEWHYLLTGELQPTAPTLVLIDVTVEFDGVTYVYAGALEQWKTTAAGKLERLHLTGVARKTIGQALNPNAQFEQIPGDEFIVWCDTIKTLNITYLDIQAKSP